MGRKAVVAHQVIRIAHMAGGGASAGQIAAAFGPDVSVERIFAICRRHGIAFVPKTGRQTAFMAVVGRKTLAAITDHAVERGVCPETLAAGILDEVVDDELLLRSLVTDACAEDG